MAGFSLSAAKLSSSAMLALRWSSAVQRSPITLVAWLSLGSFVSGLLHRSIVLAVGFELLPHHVSHLTKEHIVNKLASAHSLPWELSLSQSLVQQ
mmetsp:Transcript_9193/g.22120  ORF Transcript_9193/g.22120 Transcript_9193/m.22120 type:complete len:95 (+) Transcript_9193:173-457(+)